MVCGVSYLDVSTLKVSTPKHRFLPLFPCRYGFIIYISLGFILLSYQEATICCQASSRCYQDLVICCCHLRRAVIPWLLCDLSRKTADIYVFGLSRLDLFFRATIDYSHAQGKGVWSRSFHLESRQPNCSTAWRRGFYTVARIRICGQANVSFSIVDSPSLAFSSGFDLKYKATDHDWDQPTSLHQLWVNFGTRNGTELVACLALLTFQCYKSCWIEYRSSFSSTAVGLLYVFNKM